MESTKTQAPALKPLEEDGFFNLEEAILHTDVRAFLLADNVLPRELLEDIMAEFPADKTAYTHQGWKGGRVSMQYGTEEFSHLMSKSPAIKKLADYLTSKEAFFSFYSLFAEEARKLGLKPRYQDPSQITFEPERTEFVVTTSKLRKAYIKLFYNPIYRKYNLRSRFRGFMQSFRKPTAYPLLSMSYSDTGYQEPVHLDARHKIIAGLIYLDNLEEGGELLLYKTKAHTDLKDSVMYPEMDELDEVVRSKSTRNRMVVFLNSNNLHHGTTPFEGLRRFFYFAYAFKDEESVFETSYRVNKGDASKAEKQ